MRLHDLRGPVSPLVVIESFGQLQAMRNAFRTIANELWGGTLPWIVATMGHLMASPRDLSLVGIDAEGIEHARSPRKQDRLDAIVSAAVNRHAVLLMTDADDEGEVIAADAARSLLQSGFRGPIYRVRPSSIDTRSIRRALEVAEIFNPGAAIPGFARSAHDRLLGATYSSRHRSTGRGIAVGRVLTALLGAAHDERLPIGEVTIRRRSASGGPDFSATIPVAGRDRATRLLAIADGSAMPPLEGERSPNPSPMPALDSAIDAIKRETFAPHPSIMASLQELYQDGLISYPRTMSSQLAEDTFDRLCDMMQLRGGAFLPMDRLQVHEALHPIAPAPFIPEIGADLRRKCHSIVYRLAYDAIAAHVQEVAVIRVPWPAALGSSGEIPLKRQVTPAGTRSQVQSQLAIAPGFRGYDIQESVFVALTRGPCLERLQGPPMRLGSPSTWVDHAERFAELRLVDESMRLTAKGRSWHALSPRELLDVERSWRHSEDLEAAARIAMLRVPHADRLSISDIDRAVVAAGRTLVDHLRNSTARNLAEDLLAAMDPAGRRTLAMIESTGSAPVVDAELAGGLAG